MERNAVQSPRVQRFVHNMRTLRERRGWSTQRLEEEVFKWALREGEQVRIPRSILTNLENDRRATLTLDEALAVAAVLDTTVGWLCEYEGPRCTRCADNPPDGYACLACGAESDVRFKPHKDSDD